MAIQIPDANVSNRPGPGANARNPAGRSSEISQLQDRLRKLRDKKTKLEAAIREWGGKAPPKLNQDHQKVCQEISDTETSIARMEKDGRESGQDLAGQPSPTDGASPDRAQKAAEENRPRPESAPAQALANAAALYTDGSRQPGDGDLRRRFDRYEPAPPAQGEAGIFYGARRR